MADIRIAKPTERRIKPAFTVEKLEGKIKTQLHGWDTKGNKTVKTVETPAGFLVRFSKGHSIRVPTEADLKRLGFDQTIPLVDAGGIDDEVLGQMDNQISSVLSANAA